MTSAAAGPVRLRARLDTPLSRWLWLVKWLLVLPHAVVLALLWVAFGVLSVGAFVAILITGRYPYAIFTFNLGVLRWTWRVVYYTYGALGTDRYPPFTLGEVPDYPATLDVGYPEHLSRGLVLVKWWLLALPHYLVLAFFLGSSSYVAYRAVDTSAPDAGWSFDGGLIGLLALIAGIALLFTGRYPRGVFDLLLGLHRWVLRVAAYAALMTDAYPPFRLDLGGADPADLPVSVDQPLGSGAEGERRTASPGPVTPSSSTGWSGGRATAVVIGALVVVAALSAVVGGAVLMTTDRGGRDADGFLTTGPIPVTSPGYAVVLDPMELQTGAGAPELGTTLGDVRVTATGAAGSAVFVGIGPADDVGAYLAGVERTRLTSRQQDGRSAPQQLPGGRRSGGPSGDVDRRRGTVGGRRDERRREPARHRAADRRRHRPGPRRYRHRSRRRRRRRPAGRRPPRRAGTSAPIPAAVTGVHVRPASRSTAERRPVVVGVDGSDSARHAADWAADVAAAWGVPLRLLHATPGPGPREDGDPRWLRELCDAAERAGVEEVDRRIVTGPVADELIEQSRAAAMVVVGSYGEGARSGMLAGSTALALVDGGGCPVAVIRGTAPQVPPPRRGPVVVGMDTGGDVTALHTGAKLADALGTRLCVLHAWSDVTEQGQGVHRSTASGTELAARAVELLNARVAPLLEAYPALAVERHVVDDTALRALLGHASTARVVVVGHRRGRGTGGRLGSTSRGLVGFAPCPVVVTRGGP